MGRANHLDKEAHNRRVKLTEPKDFFMAFVFVYDAIVDDYMKGQQWKSFPRSLPIQIYSSIDVEISILSFLGWKLLHPPFSAPTHFRISASLAILHLRALRVIPTHPSITLMKKQKN